MDNQRRFEKLFGRIAMTKYEVIFHWSAEDEAFMAEVPELPGCMADGAMKSVDGHQAHVR
jgi:hypothetical protein